jgi:hypothetical protein
MGIWGDSSKNKVYWTKNRCAMDEALTVRLRTLPPFWCLDIREMGI